MPKITSYNLEWLSKPHPGHNLFTSSPTSNGAYHDIPDGADDEELKDAAGPRRTVARRGTEIFVAVGKEIRWADLAYLRDRHEETKKKKGKRGDDGDGEAEGGRAQGHRVIKVPVADNIRQLIISPRSDYVAILTKHTVHIGVLPTSSHLTAEEKDPLKIKTYTLGPTTHVTSQSAIASAIWHPLGVSGLCLVTVTTDAVVRVWELSIADRWSFDRPSLSINLQKLADGTSQDQDFSASTSGLGKSVSFSPDSFEMEVASACFASRGSGGWSSMTLWVAMKEGDVYALCPLLPEKWSPPTALIPSLSVSIVANLAAVEDDQGVTPQKKQLAQQQLAWMSDIDAQEPHIVEASDGLHEEVYTRPSKPGRVPKLQGPFDFDLAPAESEDEYDSMLTDIYAIGPKVDSDQLMFGEEDELDVDEADEGLSIGILCLLTRSGRLQVCLDIEGVEAQWLPRTKSNIIQFDKEVYPSLLTFQTLDTMRSDELGAANWPMFSPDFDSRYSFYVTNSSNVVFLSLTSWVFRLETELAEEAAGTDFRIDLLAKGQSTIRSEIHHQKMDDPSNPLSAATLFKDSDLGYFMLTANSYGPAVVVFEGPAEEEEYIPKREQSPDFESDSDQPLILYGPRPIYEPSHNLEVPTSLTNFLSSLRTSKYSRLLNDSVRLSPATLTILTDAHKILSEETHRLGMAAAELFRRIEVLQTELKQQISKANEVAARVEAVTGDDVKDGPVEGENERIVQRIEKARETQKKLTDRLNTVKQKIGKGGRRDLSERERLWLEEVHAAARNILPSSEIPAISSTELDIPQTTKDVTLPWQRYEQAEDLHSSLMSQYRELLRDIEGTQTPLSSSSGNIGERGMRVPKDVRKQKLDQITKLLERESALVEAAKTRLEKLSLSA